MCCSPIWRKGRVVPVDVEGNLQRILMIDGGFGHEDDDDDEDIDSG